MMRFRLAYRNTAAEMLFYPMHGLFRTHANFQPSRIFPAWFFAFVRVRADRSFAVKQSGEISYGCLGIVSKGEFFRYSEVYHGALIILQLTHLFQLQRDYVRV